MNKVIINKHEHKNCRLKHGDIIEFGRTRLLVQAIVQAEVSVGTDDAEVRSRRALKRKLAIAASVLFVAGATFAIIQKGDPSIPDEPSIDEQLQIAPTNITPDITATVPLPTAPDQMESPPLDSELKKIREDLSFIQMHLQQLNATPLATEQSPPAPYANNTVAKMNEIEVAMKAARDAMNAGNNEEAAMVLDHIQEEYPDYLPAYRLRAEVFEKTGDFVKAREQWTFIMQRTSESELYRKAIAERTRLGRLQNDKNPGIRDGIKISALDQIRFQASNEYDDMRVIKVKISYDRKLGPIDPSGIRLVVYFFEQDLDTKQIHLSTVKRYTSISANQLTLDANGEFVGTIDYVVPKGYYTRNHHTSRQRYFGCMARLHYFDELIAAEARPAKLLDPAIVKSVNAEAKANDPASL